MVDNLPNLRPSFWMSASLTRQAVMCCTNSGSEIPKVEARKRCSRDLFTSSGRATALIDRHIWYTFLQQSMTRLTNTAILLTYTSRFRRDSQEIDRNIFANVTSGVLGRRAISLWVVTGFVWQYAEPVLCRCGMYQCTTDSRKLKLLEKYPWMAGVTFIKFSTSLFHRCIWYNLLRRGGPNDRMTVENIGKWQNLLTAFHWWPPYSAAPASCPTLFDYNNFKVSKSPRTPAWISNHTHYKLWGKITYPFLNLIRLTHILLDKMAAIAQTIFSDAFSWMIRFVFWLKIH